MSNSKLFEEVETFGVDACNIVHERLLEDELTAEQEKESKTGLDENPGNMTNCAEAGAGKMKA